MHVAKAIMVCTAIAALVSLSGCTPEFVTRLIGAFRDQLGTPSPGQTCGDGSRLAALVADCPFEGVCFTDACAAHDLCYGACQASQSECDRRFRHDMIDRCNDSFALDDWKLRECLYFANIYWSVVDLAGYRFYECTHIPFEPRPGACCSFESQSGDGGVDAAATACQDVPDRTACSFQSVFLSDLTCEEVVALFGGCPLPLNDDCADRLKVCDGAGPGVSLGRCNSSTDVSPQTDNRVCNISSQDCAFGDVCLPHDGEAFRCIVQGDNRLAGTDGPDPDEACGFGDAGRFQADIWFEYVALCSGVMTVQLCDGTFYDAVLAIYGTDEPESGCACPSEESPRSLLLSCDDDSCGGFATGSIASIPVVESGCYILRVGGWSIDGMASGASRGISRLDIGILCD